MFSIVRHFDWWLLGSVFGLSGIGLLSLWSTSPPLFTKQALFLGGAILLCGAAAVLDYRLFQRSAGLLLALHGGAILLLAGLFVFAPEIRGTHTWYQVGPISFNPAEVVKITLLLLLSKFFSMRHTELYRWVHIAVSGAYVLIPAVLIAAQPNAGTALVVMALWLGMLLVSGIKGRQVLILVLAAIVVLTLAWSFALADYQKERITSFLRPGSSSLGGAYQQQQARIAVGAGGVFGQGLKQGSQVQRGFLPEAQTDFVFAAIAEELGLIGSSAIIVLYIVLLWRLFRFAVSAPRNFPRLLSAGTAVMIGVPAIINIGMNLGILPVIGVPLPFVSYGGSMLASSFAVVGLVESAIVRQHV